MRRRRRREEYLHSLSIFRSCADFTPIDPDLLYGFVEEEEEEEEEECGEEKPTSDGVGQTELANDLSKDNRQSLGDDYSLVGDPMLYETQSVTSSYQSVSSTDTGRHDTA